MARDLPKMTYGAVVVGVDVVVVDLSSVRMSTALENLVPKAGFLAGWASREGVAGGHQ